MKKFVSALPALTPVQIINVKTGDFITNAELNSKIELLTNTVFQETERLYQEHKDMLHEELKDCRKMFSPSQKAWSLNIKTNFQTTLSPEVKVKSRVEKLVQHNLVSGTLSYVNNPQAGKLDPSFGKSINLGAVDKQMVTLSIDNNELNLLWKCWDEEYFITFRIPSYILVRNVIKYSLPLVTYNKKKNSYDFIFTITEQPLRRKGTSHTAGIDLGKVKPYSMAVVNHKGDRVASYESTPHLNGLSQKRERLIAESYAIKQKIHNRSSRSLLSPIHKVELIRKKDKIERLTKSINLLMASEISRRLRKHNSSLVHMENLKWITGTKNSKIGSSRWSHSLQQEAITHAVSRIGYETKRVSARNTSQECHKCKCKISYNRKTRTVFCKQCKSHLDRDFNAAMNIAKTSIFPASKRLNGDITLTPGVTHKSKEVALGKIDATLFLQQSSQPRALL